MSNQSYITKLHPEIIAKISRMIYGEGSRQETKDLINFMHSARSFYDESQNVLMDTVSIKLYSSEFYSLLSNLKKRPYLRAYVKSLVIRGYGYSPVLRNVYQDYDSINKNELKKLLRLKTPFLNLECLCLKYFASFDFSICLSCPKLKMLMLRDALFSMSSNNEIISLPSISSLVILRGWDFYPSFTVEQLIYLSKVLPNLKRFEVENLDAIDIHDTPSRILILFNIAQLVTNANANDRINPIDLKNMLSWLVKIKWLFIDFMPIVAATADSPSNVLTYNLQRILNDDDDTNDLQRIWNNHDFTENTYTPITTNLQRILNNHDDDNIRRLIHLTKTFDWKNIDKLSSDLNNADNIFLIQTIFDINLQSTTQFPIEIAMTLDNTNLVQALLKLGAIVPSNQIENLQILLDPHGNGSEDLLLHTIEDNQIEMSESLIRHGVHLHPGTPVILSNTHIFRDSIIQELLTCLTIPEHIVDALIDVFKLDSGLICRNNEDFLIRLLLRLDNDEKSDLLRYEFMHSDEYNINIYATLILIDSTIYNNNNAEELKSILLNADILAANDFVTHLVQQFLYSNHRIYFI